MCLMSVMTPMEFSRAEYSALFRRKQWLICVESCGRGNPLRGECTEDGTFDSSQVVSLINYVTFTLTFHIALQILTLLSSSITWSSITFHASKRGIDWKILSLIITDFNVISIYIKLPFRWCDHPKYERGTLRKLRKIPAVFLMSMSTSILEMTICIFSEAVGEYVNVIVNDAVLAVVMSDKSYTSYSNVFP
jgi:hypothetical protein